MWPTRVRNSSQAQRVAEDVLPVLVACVVVLSPAVPIQAHANLCTSMAERDRSLAQWRRSPLEDDIGRERVGVLGQHICLRRGDLPDTLRGVHRAHVRLPRPK